MIRKKFFVKVIVFIKIYYARKDRLGMQNDKLIKLKYTSESESIKKFNTLLLHMVLKVI